MNAFRLRGCHYFEVPNIDRVEMFEIPSGEIVLCLTEEPIQLLSQNFLWWTHIFLTSAGIVHRSSYREELLWGMDPVGISA